MTRPNGLDVPEAVVALVAAQPFPVTVRPEARPGQGDALLLTEGATRWSVQASYGYGDPVGGRASAPTLRTAVLHAIEARAVRHEDAARVAEDEGKRARLPLRKQHATETAAKHRAEAARLRDLVREIAAAWPEVAP